MVAGAVTLKREPFAVGVPTWELIRSGTGGHYDQMVAFGADDEDVEVAVSVGVKVHQRTDRGPSGNGVDVRSRDQRSQLVAVGFAHVQVEITRSLRMEHQTVAVRRPGGAAIECPTPGQIGNTVTGGGGGVDVPALVAKAVHSTIWV